jgi:hypothetical protein
LQEVFPTKTEEEIITALLDCDGNTDRAFELLLNEKPVTKTTVAAKEDTMKDELLATELQKALQEAEEQRRKTQQYENFTKRF